ncbi:MAG: TIGR03545 family protein [Colwellia sp.]|nr:TIGR03545 family protein [Colwellia sp.]
MSRLFRWQGLAVFFAVIALIATFVYFFADSLVKNGIEKSGEWYLGAEVNVEDVEITYAPLTLNIKGFQATDPENPTHNLVSFAQASVGLDIWQYFFGKIYISELNVIELKLEQARKSVGEVYILADEQSSNAQQPADDSGLPKLDISLPKVDDLLKNSDLLTVKHGQALEQSYQEEKKKLLAMQKKLPTKARLAQYKKQITALGNTKIKSLADIEKLNQQFNVLKKQFKADKALISAAKEQVVASKRLLAKQTLALKNSPSADWKNIESKYQLDKVEGADFAHMLFGEKAREYYGYADTVYQKIAPLVTAAKADTKNAADKANTAKNKGRFIHFTEQRPLPDVLIVQANFSLVLDQGEFAISGKELTHQHWVRGIKSTISVESTNVQGSGELNLSLDFKLDQNKILHSKGQWQLNKLALAEVALQQSSAFTLQLDSGLLSGNGTFSLLDNQLISDNELMISQASYSGTGDSHLSKLFINTIRSLQSLALNISAKGKLTDPKLSISSPLDKQLKKSMMQQVSKKLTAFKTDVKARLNAKLTNALGVSNKEGESLLDIEGLINDTDSTLDKFIHSDVIKAKKKEFADKQKKKLEDKLKKKLGKLFG